MVQILFMIAADKAMRKPFATWRNNSYQFGSVLARCPVPVAVPESW